MVCARFVCFIYFLEMLLISVTESFRAVEGGHFLGIILNEAVVQTKQNDFVLPNDSEPQVIAKQQNQNHRYLLYSTDEGNDQKITETTVSFMKTSTTLMKTTLKSSKETTTETPKVKSTTEKSRIMTTDGTMPYETTVTSNTTPYNGCCNDLKVRIKPRTIREEEGHDIVFYCSLENDVSNIRFKWIKEIEELCSQGGISFTSNRIQCTSENQNHNVGKLILQNTATDDSGIYYCTINIATECCDYNATAQAKLVVYRTPLYRNLLLVVGGICAVLLFTCLVLVYRSHKKEQKRKKIYDKENEKLFSYISFDHFDV